MILQVRNEAYTSGALSFKLYVITTTSTYYFIPFLGSTVTTTAITWHYRYISGHKEGVRAVGGVGGCQLWYVTLFCVR